MGNVITVEDIKRVQEILNNPKAQRAALVAEGKCVACWRKMVLECHSRPAEDVVGEYLAILSICEAFRERRKHDNILDMFLD